MAYEVVILQSARKDLLALDKPIRERVGQVIGKLGADPRPAGAVTVIGQPGALRVRAGDYRVVYQVDDDRLVVEVLKIGHRSKIYRR